MNVANVGDVEAVLCRHGEPLLLTKKFVTSADRDECQRVAAADGIITEVSAGSPATIIKPPPRIARALSDTAIRPSVCPSPRRAAAVS